MKTITIFSWGYYGWGNSTKQLVKAVDAVEESRGFKPPIFVDIRIRRSVRAPGFREKEFEKLLGKDRYQWIRRLGNDSIITKANKIKIADPSAASDLLDLAVAASKQKRRIIFFCGCQFPKRDGEVKCHRTEVARFVLGVSKKKGIPIEVVEWPGGKPGHIDLEVDSKLFRAVANGRWSIPIGGRPELSEVAALPWGTTLTIHADGKKLHRLVGPATHERGEWCLPVIFRWEDADVPLAEYKRDAAKVRKDDGYEPRRSK